MLFVSVTIARFSSLPVMAVVPIQNYCILTCPHVVSSVVDELGLDAAVTLQAPVQGNAHANSLNHLGKPWVRTNRVAIISNYKNTWSPLTLY